jgi:hypothetical protein
MVNAIPLFVGYLKLVFFLFSWLDDHDCITLILQGYH